METELNVAASFKDVDVQPEPVELPQEIGKEMDRLQHNGLSFAEYIYAMRELELTDKSSERLLMQAWLFGWVAKPAEEGKDD
ncbi:hypothetical protein IV38_GL001949 [Lactobacillus selangorensis]|uniref:Uncharacterized protein n=2 Tax=Lactobacillus selangorensis TaxID=81857 RepID=A0A0R2FYC9_9LACO|nr:hypothetical protein IV38_GL001949 [Lactobacillus selangorensis]KRN30300.1 hypothetical protein IV40_GL001888 [Lactobacillus selangorensis]